MARRSKKAQRFAARYGRSISIRRIRQVWAVVTRRPNASTREIASALGLKCNPPDGVDGSVATALRFLRDAGYIDFETGSARAREIIVPFIVIERS